MEVSRKDCLYDKRVVHGHVMQYRIRTSSCSVVGVFFPPMDLIPFSGLFRFPISFLSDGTSESESVFLSSSRHRGTRLCHQAFYNQVALVCDRPFSIAWFGRFVLDQLLRFSFETITTRRRLHVCCRIPANLPSLCFSCFVNQPTRRLENVDVPT